MIDYKLTVTIILILIGIVTLIIRSMIKDSKKGIHTSCGGNCGNCRMACVHSINLPKHLN